MYDIDYEETFSPIVKLNTVRILLSLAANLDWPLHQYDVKNAFLHGDLEEEIYMDIPLDYLVPSQDKLVCKLERALYVIAPIIYIDDMIIIGNDTKKIVKIHMQLSTKFEMKNLGGLKYFLGTEVVRSYEDIFISKRKYVLDLLFEVRMLDYKPVGIPITQAKDIWKM
ncbi:hypothetical protein CR513_17875, partial [Mucuna pruriens]